MQEYEPRRDEDNSTDPAAEDGGLPPELTEETETAFVAESASPARGTAVLLTTLLAIGAATIGFMRFRAGPSKAVAAAPETASAQATISQFLSGKGVDASWSLLKDTEKLRLAFINYPSMAQVKVEDLLTNPFRLSAPKAPGVDEEAVRRKQEEEARKQKEAEKQAIVKALGQLKVQSIMHSGATRSCMINNTYCTEGQEIAGFLIERISPDAVVMRKGGYRFELRMNR